MFLSLMCAAAVRTAEAQDTEARSGDAEARSTGTLETGAETLRREVRITLYLVDLVEIEGAEQTFFADVFLGAEWYDPELDGAFEAPRTIDLTEAWHPQLLFVNLLSTSQDLPQRLHVQPDGSVQYRQRYTGRFSAPMNLRAFPLDSQELDLWLVVVPRLGEETVLVPDERATLLASDRLSVSDWRLGGYALEAREFRATPRQRPIPGIALTMQAERLKSYYLIQVLFPLVCIVLMGWTVFWVSPAVVPTRMGVVVTTMLTIFAYRFMLVNHVPRLSYLTRLDYFMLGATIVIMLALFTMAGTSYLTRTGREEVVEKIDRVGRVLYPLTFGVYSLIVWLL